MTTIAYDGKLCIATPFYNMWACSEYVIAMIQTCRVLEKTGVNFDVFSVNDSYIDRARNSLCARFLDSDCTDLFFIDSDESWDVFGFFRVLMSPYDVVGGSYKMKNNWGGWTATIKTNGEHPYGRKTGEDSAVLGADILPCGFMRLKRAALEKFRDAYPDLTYTDQGKTYTAFFESSRESGEYNGEDVTFCKRWAKIGGELWLEPKVTITHYGMTGWEGNLDEQLRKNIKESVCA